MSGHRLGTIGIEWSSRVREFETTVSFRTSDAEGPVDIRNGEGQKIMSGYQRVLELEPYDKSKLGLSLERVGGVRTSMHPAIQSSLVDGGV